MSSRALALVLTLVGAGVLFLRVPEEAATATGLLGAVLALAAIWLTSGRVRRVLAALAAAAWAGTLVLAVSVSAIAVFASASGLAGAVIAVVRGGAWPGWSSRYARSDQIGEDEADNPRMMWESLDRGMDPTRRPDASTDD
ncbi:MAG: Trp biosynthesis-associated membrane protein [Candidatus Nanopelagicales bacterium]